MVTLNIFLFRMRGGDEVVTKALVVGVVNQMLVSVIW